MKWVPLIMQGNDRIEFSQRLITADILALKPGEGAGSCLLTAKGKLESFFWVCFEADRLIFLAEMEALDGLQKAFSTYHFSEHIEMGFGDKLNLSLTANSSKIGTSVFKENDDWLIHWRGLDFRFGSSENSDDESKSLRIRCLIPSFSEELCPGRLVFETGLEEFCSDTKGCYIGQEVVERVRSRGGQASQRLARLSFKERPRVEEKLVSKLDGSMAGQLTRSINNSQALGYIKRKYLKTGHQFLGESSQLEMKLETFV